MQSFVTKDVPPGLYVNIKQELNGDMFYWSVRYGP